MEQGECILTLYSLPFTNRNRLTKGKRNLKGTKTKTKKKGNFDFVIPSHYFLQMKSNYKNFCTAECFSNCHALHSLEQQVSFLLTLLALL